MPKLQPRLEIKLIRYVYDNIKSADMPNFRRVMKYEILSNKLIC